MIIFSHQTFLRPTNELVGIFICKGCSEASLGKGKKTADNGSMDMSLNKTVVLIVAIAVMIGGTHGQTVEEVFQSVEFTGGLVVHLGVGDGRLTADLSKNGTFLVQGLTSSKDNLSQAREHIRAQNLYGLVSVDYVSSFGTLPFHTELANIVVGDLGDLGAQAPELDEIKRILVPGGIAYVKENGAWTRVVKEWPQEYDEWTHFDYGPQGNAISHDTRVGPKRSLKWIDWYQRSGFGRRHFMGYRTNVGMTVHETRFRHDIDGRREDGNWVTGRDAFNGLPLWYHEADESTSEIVLADGKAYMLKPKGMDKLVQVNIRTGEIEKEYENSLPAEEGIRDAGRVARIVVFDNALFQAAHNSVVALDPESGSKKWQVSEPGAARLTFMVGSPEENKIFVVATTGEGNWSRWPGEEATAVICLNSEDGTELWRNTELSGKYVGNLIYNDGKLLVFNSFGIGSSPDWGTRDEDGNRGPQSNVGLIRTSDGELLWMRRYQEEGSPIPSMTAIHAPLIHDGQIQLAGSEGRFEMDFDGNFGEQRREKRISNQRCNRPRGTDRFFMTGFGIMQEWQQDGKYVYQEVTRSDCASGSWPAYGMQYYSPNDCNCFIQVRGHSAYASHPLSPPVPDTERLETVDGAVPEFDTVQFVKTSRKHDEYPREEKDEDDPREFRVDITAPPQFSQSPIRDSWRNNDFIPYPETEPLVAGDMTYVGVVNEHRLEARKGGSVQWSFTAGGRITRPPVLHNGTLYFGSHDGYVYAVDQQDGSLQWRFLGGANHKRIVAYGQVESSWPVYGVVVDNETVIFSAGRHPEVDHGLFVWGIDAETGVPMWKTQVYSEYEWRDNGTPPDQTFYNWTINRVPEVENGSVTLPGVVIDPGQQGEPLNLRKAPSSNNHDKIRLLVGNGITVQIPARLTGNVTLRILDMRGRTLFSRSAKGSRSIQVAPAAIPTRGGTYLLEVKHREGSLRRTLCLVK